MNPSQYLEQAEREVASPTAVRGVAPQPFQTVVVVGGGLMGAGIAASCLNADLQVTILERDRSAVEAARARAEALLRGGLKRGKLTQEAFETRRDALSVSDDYTLSRHADIAIEAVFEDLEVKREVFQRLAAELRPDALLATNTSYLDPRAIAEGVPGPGRILGLHFFSPAHIMKLLEIVRTPQTGAEVLATAFALARRLGKVGVLCGICDGFIGNRMLRAYRRQADYLLADGASPEQVDRAVRDFGMPMGPYELQDLTGLHIAWANRQRRALMRDPAVRYVPIADRLCEQGRLGQRTLRGWYRYEEGSRTPQPDPEVLSLLERYRNEAGLEPQLFSDTEIQERLVAVLANEGARIVEEGVAESERAVDVVKVRGYGFPRERGGPLHYAHTLGHAQVKRILQNVTEQSPHSWHLAQLYRS